MRKLFFIFILCLSACTLQSKKAKDSSVVAIDSMESPEVETSTLPAENTLVISAAGDTIYNIHGPLVLKKISDSIFLGRLVSKDGATTDNACYLPIPYTLGTIEVLERYYGDVEGKMSFRIFGAIIGFKDYLYLDAQIGGILHLLPAVICGTIVNICI